MRSRHPTRTTAPAAADAGPISSFGPLLGESPRILILGSMPGVASLEAEAYYAHPRNAFWPIMIAWLDGTLPDRATAFAIPYAERCARLCSAGIALWDVLGSCERPGSLDSAIVRGSERANDLAGLIGSSPTIARVVFNGRAAEQSFARHVELGSDAPERVAAPSTSPAMASLSLTEKYDAWCRALGG